MPTDGRTTPRAATVHCGVLIGIAVLLSAPQAAASDPGTAHAPRRTAVGTATLHIAGRADFPLVSEVLADALPRGADPVEASVDERPDVLLPGREARHGSDDPEPGGDAPRPDAGEAWGSDNTVGRVSLLGGGSFFVVALLSWIYRRGSARD